ncbi:MAG TPA: BON domain-containing protein [Acidimicrobiales bacterium]|nr:BON domain-containing protein [Acidimicrobiales bacterium]
MSLFRKLLPFSRITIVLWAWRNRASVAEWFAFALRAFSSASSGNGLDDAKAEFRLRANLARDGRTRGALVDVAVEDGVAHLHGRLAPEVHAVVQDIAVGTRGVSRIDDRITHTLARGGLLRRKAG